MKMPVCVIVLAIVGWSAVPCFSQAVAVVTSTETVGRLVEPFSGRIAFHQKDGPTVYDVAITNGRVSGHEFLGSDPEPIADLVGGWFDYKTGRLSLLIQVTAKRVAERWRSQLQQFRVDPQTKEVTLEHMLYDYGTTQDNAKEFLVTAHTLDTFEVTVRLVDQR